MTVLAQATADAVRKISPVSPTAAAFAKYVDIPVNLATGTPQISIPLYTIAGEQLSLPISLSYQATGVRVSEQASWVGLGWSLNAGGSISRSVRGKLDNEEYETHFLNRDSLRCYTEYPFVVDQQDHPDRDGAPDLYTFNINSVSGKFVMIRVASADSFILIPRQSVLIRRNRVFHGQAGGMEIVDKDGVSYEFGAIEAMDTPHSQDTPGAPGSRQTTSWYVTRIVSADGKDEINFEYQEEAYHLNTVESENKVYKRRVAGGDMQQVEYSKVNKTSVMYGQFLRRIVFSLGVVNFYSSPTRLDIEPMPALGQPDLAHRLDSIVVRDKKGGLIKKYIMHYSYFSSSASIPTQYSSGNRLRLDLLAEDANHMDLEEPETKKYQFRYQEEDRLPDVSSNDQDHWGYYNGPNNASTLIPGTDLTDSVEQGVPKLFNARYHITGPLRRVNTRYAKAGVLTKVIYPTGGYSSYTYESNDYGFIAKNPIPLTYHMESHPMQVVEVWSSNMKPQGWPVRQICNESSFFTVSQPMLANVVTFADANMDVVERRKNHACLYLYEDETAPQPLDSIVFYFPDVATSKLVSMIIMPGTYRLGLCLRHATGNLRCNFSYETGVPNPPRELGGGLRIKQILLHDGISHENDIVKTYSYRMAGDTARSSGSLSARPLYIGYRKGPYYGPGNINDDDGDVNDMMNIPCISPIYQDDEVVYSASSQGPANGTKPIVYQRVIERLRGALTGETHYYFPATDSAKAPNDPYQFDYMTAYPSAYPYSPDDETPLRTDLLMKVVLNSDGDTLYKVSNFYSQINSLSKEIYGFSFAKTPTCISPCYNGVLPESPAMCTRPFSYNYFKMKSAFSYLAQSKEVYYTPGLLVNKQKVTSYKYSSGTLLPVRVAESFATGDSIVTVTRYPKDYASATSTVGASGGIMRLQNWHCLTTPIEELTWRVRNQSRNLVKGRVSEYEYSALTGLVLKRKFELITSSPLAISSFNPTAISSSGFIKASQYQLQTTFEVYDHRGNLLQERNTSDAPLSYIWGYRSMLPIAEVKNATEDRIAFTSFELGSPGNWLYDTLRCVSGGCTGEWSFAFGNGALIQSRSLPAGAYSLTYWSTSSSPLNVSGNVNYSNSAPVQMHNGWYRHQMRLAITASTALQLTGSGQVDELRLHPSDAQMTSYVHRPLIGLTSQTTPSLRINSYLYDRVGRLSSVTDDTGAIVKQHQYQYAK